MGRQIYHKLKKNQATSHLEERFSITLGESIVIIAPASFSHLIRPGAFG